MRKRFWNDITAGLHLQTIVTDHTRRTECFVDVPWIQNAAIVIGKHTGEAVRLKLNAHRSLVGTAARRLLRDAQQVLHVMPDLVRDDICLGKIAGRMKPIP